MENNLKRVSQIYLTDNNYMLPMKLDNLSNKIKTAYDDYEYTLYNDATLQEFLRNNFETEVLWAYCKLSSYSCRADLGRYCLMYALGGWYFDIGVSLHNKIEFSESDGVNMLLFRELLKNTHTSYACATSVLYSKPHNEIYRTAIDMIIQNCKDEYYGLTPLCPTAPSLLGRSVAHHGTNGNIMYGDVLQLTPTHNNKNEAFVMPDGTIIVFKKQADGGDLTTLGGIGTNNYNVLWNSGKFYHKI